MFHGKKKPPAKKSASVNTHPAKQDNLQLANAVLKKMKVDIVSSNDIISRSEMPDFILHEMEKYVTRFGDDNVKAFIDNMNHLKKIRDTGVMIIGMYAERFQHPVAARAVATTFFGVGECEETTNRATMELGLAGCTATINLISLKQTPGRSPDDQPFMHAMIVIGDCSNITDNFDSFKLLNDDCVLMDPFLGIVGQANQFSILLKDYLQANRLNSVKNVIPVNCSAAEYMQLKTEAEFLADEITKNLDYKMQTPDASVAASVLYNIRNPTFNFALQMSLACEKTEKGPEILEAVSKAVYAQAFRKACAYGELDIVKLLLKNRLQLLGNFNLNEPSSNGNTALDWVQKTKYDAVKMKDVNEISRLIVAAGALTSENLKSVSESKHKI